MARRTFLGFTGITALSFFLPFQAFAGVGGGAWGSCGASAAPGNHFGYDGGWGCSRDGKVWLSVSANCTIGRMTELYLQIDVTSYYANGGVWNPTWSTDYADTHVDSFIRNSSSWVSSKSGYYDTTYDSSSYHGPYVTDSLRVKREASDWWAWAGVRAWCDSNDNAYGINTTAEASQLIPHNVVVDDRSWQRKIVVLRPKAAPALFADCAGGATAGGTNVLAWETTNTTNQNWIVLTSAQGRTCFVPVHTGSSPLFMDVNGGDWNDGDNIQLWTGNGGLAQSYYLHNLGNGYHLIVPECSGCAVDLDGGGQSNGTNIAQWNCRGDWTNANQLWLVEEALFKERTPGSMTISGKPEKDQTLSLPDPNEACIPYNYPGTTGMYWKYAWYRSDDAYIGDDLRLSGSAHVADVGDTPAQNATEFVGTVGEVHALEAFSLNLSTTMTGKIVYQAYISGDGWQAERSDGERAGTTGLGKPIEQMKVWLEGEVADHWKLEAQAHISDVGWGSWADGGGVIGASPNHVEAFRVRLTRLDADPVGSCKLIKGPSEEKTYRVAEEDEGSHLLCVIQAFSRYQDIAYAGKVITTSVEVPETRVAVRFFADGEADPCYTLKVRKNDPFSIPQIAMRTALKPNCSGLDGWYKDPSYQEKFVDGAALTTDLDLYARNKVDLTYQSTDRSESADPMREYYFDEALCHVASIQDALPSDEHYYYGDRANFKLGKTLWYSDVGKTRRLDCTSGVYADAKASGTPMRSARLVRNTTVYVDWIPLGYDGVILS